MTVQYQKCVPRKSSGAWEVRGMYPCAVRGIGIPPIIFRSFETLFSKEGEMLRVRSRPDLWAKNKDDAINCMEAARRNTSSPAVSQSVIRILHGFFYFFFSLWRYRVHAVS